MNANKGVRLHDPSASTASCLSPDHVGKLGLAELSVGIAQLAVLGDARKVGVGDVDAGMELLWKGQKSNY